MDPAVKLLTESGIVTRVEGDLAWVNTANKLSCSSCQVESTCGNGILEKYLAGKVFVSEINNELNARVGDRVEIAIPVSSVSHASLVVYAVPLAGLIVAAFVGDNYFESEPMTIVGSFLGLFGGLLITRFYNKKIATQTRFRPKMVAKLTSPVSASVFDAIKVKNL